MSQTIDELLLPHRNAIDTIDAEILRLLNERAQHAHAIGELKGTGAVYRPEREVAVLRRIQDLNKGPLPDESVARLFREVMSECLAVERPLTIAYLGPQGTFTQQAAIKHFGHAAHTMACPTIDNCFKQVETRQADYLVAPVENSTEGSVGRTLDLLAVTALQACGEVVLRIHHNLCVKTTAAPKRIAKVFPTRRRWRSATTGWADTCPTPNGLPCPAMPKPQGWLPNRTTVRLPPSPDARRRKSTDSIWLPSASKTNRTTPRASW